jgi:hypothetical protein
MHEFLNRTRILLLDIGGVICLLLFIIRYTQNELRGLRGSAERKRRTGSKRGASGVTVLRRKLKKKAA